MTILELVNTKINRCILDHKAEGAGRVTYESAYIGMHDYLQDFTFGGKRLRAKLCFAGAECIRPIPESSFELISDIAVAIELFHAAALIHDDLIDGSDSRRGLPAMHKRFAELHTENSFVKCKNNFGNASAILAGDILLTWSCSFFSSAMRRFSKSKPGDSLTRLEELDALWADMQNEVVLGQYLDVLHEHGWRGLSVENALDASKEIMIKKSGKYSVQVPLCLGANSNGANADQLEILKELSLPLGLAFQMRNDVEGAFANDKITGKPLSSDLASGKHTMLIGLARQRSARDDRMRLEDMLGQQGYEIKIREIIIASGALNEAENLIQKWIRDATQSLEKAPLHSVGREKLIKIADHLLRAEHKMIS